jgi:hypothetical protein
MSHMGQKRSKHDVRGISVLPPKADIKADINKSPLSARKRHRAHAAAYNRRFAAMTGLASQLVSLNGQRG